MATPWFKDPVTQSYNPPIEPGEDIGTPFHTPITALLPGTVAGVSYGGYGARVDIATPKGDVYIQHLDTVEVTKGQHIVAGQEIGLSGGQLFGGSLPNSPLNSTGPHVEVGWGGGGNPASLIAAGPQLAAGDNPMTIAANAVGATARNVQAGSNPLDLIAGVQGMVLGAGVSVVNLVKQNIIPLVVAAVIILIVLGTGEKTESAPAPQIVPVPV